jgi:hypothetical protein
MGTPNYILDNAEGMRLLSDISNQIDEELSKETVDEKKLYQLRFQQLMKGIELTQNPCATL